MAKDNGTITFWLRKDKITQDGKAPIFIIYSIRGQRCYYNTGIKVYPFSWCKKENIAKYIDKKEAKKLGFTSNEIIVPTSFDIKNINAELIEISHSINKVGQRFKLDSITITSKMVIDKYKEALSPVTKKEVALINISKWIKWYCEQPHELIKEGTIKCYNGLANHLEEFEKLYKLKVTFQNIGISVLSDFRTYLNKDKKQINITVAKEISTLNTLLNRAKVDFKINVNSEYKDFKNYQREDANFEIIALTENELEKILNYDFSNNLKLDRQKDVFLFSCFTGLRYSDLKDLSHVHISKTPKINWLKKTCEKTGKNISVPLDEIPQLILDKYQTEITPLPVISNNKCSQYIKEIAEICGLDREIVKERKVGKEIVRKVQKLHEAISIHTGRKTFVTTLLDNSNNSRDVMALTGQSSVKVMRRYDSYKEDNKIEAINRGFSKFKKYKI